MFPQHGRCQVIINHAWPPLHDRERSCQRGTPQQHISSSGSPLMFLESRCHLRGPGSAAGCPQQTTVASPAQRMVTGAARMLYLSGRGPLYRTCLQSTSQFGKTLEAVVRQHNGRFGYTSSSILVVSQHCFLGYYTCCISHLLAVCMQPPAWSPESIDNQTPNAFGPVLIATVIPKTPAMLKKKKQDKDLFYDHRRVLVTLTRSLLPSTRFPFTSRRGMKRNP